MPNNEKLTAIRKEIDAVDSEILKLFARRMDLSDDIAVVKSENNISLMDTDREESIVKSAAEAVDSSYKGEAMTFMRSLIGLSKSRQRKKLFGKADEYYFPASRAPLQGDIGVAFQGVPGAWGEIACMQVFNNAKLIANENFEDVFVAVKDKQAAYGVVPIENSQTGGIGEVYDLLRKYGCYIVGQTWVHAQHCLMAVPGASIEDVREVFSHAEGFKQCSKFLRGRAWDLTICRNTAVAAEMVALKNEKRYAAIGSRRAAELNGLSILAPDIVTDENNRTRFIVISDTPEYDEACDTVSVIFRTAHRSGALVDVLFPLLAENLNMKRLESRPVSGGKYCFFCDIEGNVKDESIENALQQAAACSGYLEVLGCYPEDTKIR